MFPFGCICWGNMVRFLLFCLPRRPLAGLVVALAPALVLVGCGSPPRTVKADSKPTASTAPALPTLPRPGSGRGGYYLDDGPGDNPPADLLETPDAEPKVEPDRASNSKPYVVFGKTYRPITDAQPFKQRGVGSWYGKKFHGKKTASGETYDMYKMTAAHPTLPLPSYARVTHLGNGKQVIVRINDRGPFLSNRIIDLSYTAALKLGYLGKGSTELEVERLLPEEIARINADKRGRLARAEQAPPAAEVVATAVATAPASAATPAAASASALPGNEPPGREAVVFSAPPVASLAPAFYLQFGAFALEANARIAREQLVQQSAWNLPGVEVVGSGAYYRLFSGPFVTRAEAAAAAMQIEGALATKPMIVQR